MPSQVFTVSNPAAGADWTYTHPDAGGQITLQSIKAKLVTDSNAATRSCLFTILDAAGNRVYDICDAAAGQIASLTVRYQLAPGGTASIAGVASGGIRYCAFALPTITIGPGWQIKVVTASKQVGDQWSEIAILGS